MQQSRPQYTVDSLLCMFSAPNTYLGVLYVTSSYEWHPLPLGATFLCADRFYLPHVTLTEGKFVSCVTPVYPRVMVHLICVHNRQAMHACAAEELRLRLETD